MKAKLAIGVGVALLVLAQFIYGGRKTVLEAAPAAVLEPAAPPRGLIGVANAGGAPEATGGAAVASPAQGATPVAAPLFDPLHIEGIDIKAGAGGWSEQLRLIAGGWRLGHVKAEPADAAKIRRLLANLAAASARPSPLPPDLRPTGLEDGGEVEISLQEKAGGGVYAFTIGFRPEGSYASACVLLPDGRRVIIPADIRGDLGLFANRTGAMPAKDFWLEKTVFSFDPGEAVRVVAEYPDHKLVFAKNLAGDWQAEGPIPGDSWSLPGFTAWLGDLAAFRIDRRAGPEEAAFTDDGKSYKLLVTLMDGSVKTLLAGQNHTGSEVQVLTSERPGGLFQMSDWRFRSYFRCLERLFPKAVAHYEHSDIRFIDLRRDGESVKIAYRDGEWRGVAVPYRVRAARMERLARYLAAWRPEDYASADFRLVRPGYGGPMLEVILANGEAHQYRLAGRHPFLPWRYVLLDGKTALAITDAAVGVMFPGFAEVLDLGRVFAPFTRAGLTRVELADSSKVLVAFAKGQDGVWRARTEAGESEVSSEEGRELFDEFMDWPVLGFSDNNLAQGKAEPAFILRLWDGSGEQRKYLILPPHEREIPYLTEGGKGFLFDRAEFFNWLGAVRGVSKRILASEGETGGR